MDSDAPTIGLIASLKSHCLVLDIFSAHSKSA